jgi:hypothetical protein
VKLQAPASSLTNFNQSEQEFGYQHAQQSPPHDGHLPIGNQLSFHLGLLRA